MAQWKDGDHQAEFPQNCLLLTRHADDRRVETCHEENREESLHTVRSPELEPPH